MLSISVPPDVALTVVAVNEVSPANDEGLERVVMSLPRVALHIL